MSLLTVISSGQVIAGAVTLIVTYSLQVTPLVVTSTQYSVVSVGVTVIFSVVSPVDQIYVELSLKLIKFNEYDSSYIKQDGGFPEMVDLNFIVEKSWLKGISISYNEVLCEIPLVEQLVNNLGKLFINEPSVLMLFKFPVGYV